MPEEGVIKKKGEVWKIWVSIVTNRLELEGIIKMSHPSKNLKRRKLYLNNKLIELFENLDNEIKNELDLKILKFTNKNIDTDSLKELRHIFYKMILTSPLGIKEVSAKRSDPISFIVTLADAFFQRKCYKYYQRNSYL